MQETRKSGDELWVGAMRAEPRPTIYDVATAAGVAPSTVSRTFARPGRVNADTAERVRQAASRLGYRTSPMARAAPSRRTRLIALVVADVTNPFHFGIIRGAESAAAESGYTMILADAQESDCREREFLERVLPVVDGVVLATPRMPDSAIRTVAKQRPTIVLNRAVPDVPSVVTDIRRGTRRALDHLSELRHETVTYVAGPEASWTGGMRWRTLHDAAAKLGVRVRRIGPFAPTTNGGAEAAASFLSEPSSAVIAYNDLVAIGLMRALQARGIDVPKDVSIVSFDDIFAADLVTPALTTVAAPLLGLGTTAVNNLLAIVGGARARVGEPVEVPTRLVVRSSTGRAASSAARRGKTAGPTSTVRRLFDERVTLQP